MERKTQVEKDKVPVDEIQKTHLVVRSLKQKPKIES